MISFLSSSIALIVMAFWIWEFKNQKAARVALSPFWYFSFIFLIAFPLRAYLLDARLLVPQVSRKLLPGIVEPVRSTDLVYSQTALIWALLFGFLMWLVIFWGRKKTASLNVIATSPIAQMLNARFAIGRMLLAGVMLIIVSAVVLLYIGEIYTERFGGYDYQKARHGSGLLWVLPEICFYGFFGLVGYYFAQRDRHLKLGAYVVLALALAMAIWISMGLFTRRTMAAALLCLIVLAVSRHQKLWPLAIGGVAATVFASPVLDFLRRLVPPVNVTFWQNLNDQIGFIFGEKFLYLLSSAFEGVGHLARLFEKATWVQLLTGVDHGLSWVFNAGLAFVPRAIWDAKPVVYGGVAQLQWLYPSNFAGDYAIAGVPMSFAVDFTFAFGLPVAVLMAYVFGRLMGVAERTLWDKGADAAQAALALFIFVYMFNWVRGGTVIVQSVVLFAVPVAMMLGLRPTLRAVFGFAGEAIGVVGPISSVISKVYFYPHAYFRDRQLDTIKNWPQDQAINADFAESRIGEQVSRDKALSTPRRSWKSRLPLVNVKLRPKGAPKDAAVYTWGGLVLNGPFMTDIDNPYAFTAYNPLAVKIFRPLISWFLESPRCLEIRCLSDACRDGVRREYGDVAYAKCKVVYPQMPPAVDQPHPQEKGRCRFLYVSTQFEIKGGAALLNAFERLVAEHSYVELDLITHLPDSYREQASRIPNLRVIDAQHSREEIMQDYMSQSDVLVHPTYMDSFGMVIAEALSYGLPVIATDVYAIREMVEDGGNGYVIQPPVSIWSGTEPTDLFSDVNKVRDCVRDTDTAQFEDILYTAMKDMAEDTDFRRRAAVASLDVSRNKFSGRA